MKNIKAFPYLTVAFLIVFFISACGGGSKSVITPVKGRNSGATDPVATHPTKPIDNPQVTPVKPKKQDTLYVLDTIRTKDYQMVLKRKFFQGSLVDVDTLEYAKLSKLPQSAKKSSYNIAIMLPFLTDQFEANGGKGVPKKSRVALLFYEGVRMALKDLDAQGISLNVSVMDTKGDSATTYALFDREDVRNADIIFGPVSSTEIKVASQRAKTMGVTLVSPLNVREDLISDNPYYVQMNPSLKTHYGEILDFAKSKYGNKVKLIAVSREDKNDLLALESLQKACEERGQKDKLTVYKTTEERIKIEEFKPLLSPGDTNLVFVTSQYDNFVTTAVRGLSTIGGFRIVTAGMPKWYEYAVFNSDDFMKARVLLSVTNYIDRDNFDVKNFRKRYFNEYRMVPDDDVFRGYESMLALGRMLKKHGTFFPPDAVNVDPQVTTSFSIQPIPADNAFGVKYFENQYVNILIYDGTKYVKVN